MLIMIDGELKLKAIESFDLTYVMNTPYVIFQDKSTCKFYLYGGEIWQDQRHRECGLLLKGFLKRNVCNKKLRGD